MHHTCRRRQHATIDPPTADLPRPGCLVDDQPRENRLHSTLGYLAPVEWELQHYAARQDQTWPHNTGVPPAGETQRRPRMAHAVGIQLRRLSCLKRPTPEPVTLSHNPRLGGARLAEERATVGDAATYQRAIEQARIALEVAVASRVWRASLACSRVGRSWPWTDSRASAMSCLAVPRGRSSSASPANTGRHRYVTGHRTG